MAATLPVGMRKLPTVIDTTIMRQILADEEGHFVVTSSLGNLDAQVLSKFKPLADAVSADLSKPLRTGLANLDWTTTDPLSSQFGWHTVGNVGFNANVATISESVGMFSDLSQSFVVPSGMRRLSFTLSGISLEFDATGSRPSDALEIALLRAQTTEPLLTSMVGTSGSDALLSIQADGKVYAAPKLTLRAGLQVLRST